ncbi:MAG: glycosyltransferase family 2 protein [Armatimonadota bacterium]
MKVTAVVPAYNEESRIGAVIDVLKHCATVDHIIVVSDGSTDKTAEIAAGFDGVTVVKLTRNRGKGGAMLEGVRQAVTEVILFLDADLIGLKPEQVEALVTPVLNNQAGMTIGIFKGGRKRTDWAQVISPFISGQRALLREDFISIPDLENTRYGIEIALSRFARQNGIVTQMVTLAGVTHPMKEEKLGFLKGTLSRSVMYWEIVKLLIQTSTGSSRLKHKQGMAANNRSSRS